MACEWVSFRTKLPKTILIFWFCTFGVCVCVETSATWNQASGKHLKSHLMYLVIIMFLVHEYVHCALKMGCVVYQCTCKLLVYMYMYTDCVMYLLHIVKG